jgi:hypothetical protein
MSKIFKERIWNQNLPLQFTVLGKSSNLVSLFPWLKYETNKTWDTGRHLD